MTTLTPASAADRSSCAICGNGIHWGGTVDPGWVHDRSADMRTPIIHAAIAAESGRAES